MPVMFNTVLAQEGIDPANVRLLRHQDTRPDTLRTPFELWRHERPAFEQYQSVQSVNNRPKFRSPFWASFVADPAGATLFVGIYKAQLIGVGEKDLPRRTRTASIKLANTIVTSSNCRKRCGISVASCMLIGGRARGHGYNARAVKTKS